MEHKIYAYDKIIDVANVRNRNQERYNHVLFKILKNVKERAKNVSYDSDTLKTI